MKRRVYRVIEGLLGGAGYSLVKKESLTDRTGECLKRVIRNERPTILDVGGHEGQSAALFLALWPQARIHSFEPDPRSFEILQRRFANDNRVIANNCAVSNYSGVGDFYFHYKTKLNSFHRINLEGREMKRWLQQNRDKTDAAELASTTNRATPVATVTLGDYVRKHGIENVDLLKIDTQGHEPEVLQGAGDFLSHVGAVHIEVMFWDMYDRSLNFRDIEDILIPHGLALFSLPRVVADKSDKTRTTYVEAVYAQRDSSMPTA